MIERRRRVVLVLVLCLLVAISTLYQDLGPKPATPANTVTEVAGITTAKTESELALQVLGRLAIKGRAPKTGYERAQFDDGWEVVGNCDIRNHILQRDMQNAVTVSESDCTVLSGTLNDPYTGRVIDFKRGPGTSTAVQIDHVVALSDAWQKGAQELTPATRKAMSNDPLNLLAVDGPANQKKSDGDAATWLPPNKDYRCRYVARQIAVKFKYKLWVTQAEHDAMGSVLGNCPNQVLPIVEFP